MGRIHDKIIDESRRKGRDPTEYEKSEIPSFGNRLASQSYLDQSGWSDGKGAGGKTEAVIKIISGGIGALSARRLFNYIARDKGGMDIDQQDPSLEDGDLAEDWGDTPLALIDEEGNFYETHAARAQLVENWSDDFKGKDAYQKQAWKDDVANWLGIQISHLKEYEKPTTLQAYQLREYQKFYSKRAWDRPLTASEIESIDRFSQRAGRAVQRNAAADKNLNFRVFAPKDTTHMMLSFGQGTRALNVKKAQILVGGFLSKTIGAEDYRYAFVLHNDKNHLHAHVVISNFSSTKGKTEQKGFRLDKADLFALRQEWATQLKKLGIEQQATLKLDRPSALEAAIKGEGYLRERASWYQSQIAKGTDGIANLVEARAQALRQVARYEASLKKTKILEAEKAADLRKQLRSLKHDFLKNEKRDFPAIREQTLKALEKDFRQLGLGLTGQQSEIKQPTFVKLGNQHRLILAEAALQRHEKQEVFAPRPVPKEKEKHLKVYADKVAERAKAAGEHLRVLSAAHDKTPEERARSRAVLDTLKKIERMAQRKKKKEIGLFLGLMKGKD